jgi:hypothetical protein
MSNALSFVTVNSVENGSLGSVLARGVKLTSARKTRKDNNTDAATIIAHVDPPTLFHDLGGTVSGCVLLGFCAGGLAFGCFLYQRGLCQPSFCFVDSATGSGVPQLQSTLIRVLHKPLLHWWFTGPFQSRRSPRARFSPSSMSTL